MSIKIFFFNDTATTEIYTLSLHDALPICLTHIALALRRERYTQDAALGVGGEHVERADHGDKGVVEILVWELPRSEEHTSELQSRQYLVCRLLLEKKKQNLYTQTMTILMI